MTDEYPQEQSVADPEGTHPADLTGTATGADGADNTALEGETFPTGDPETVAYGDGNRGPLGETFDS